MAVDIKKAINKNKGFLAYIKANALLHDSDKMTEIFLRWSIDKRTINEKYYPGHNVGYKDRNKIFSLMKKEGLIDDQPQIDSITFPVSRIAMELRRLRIEAIRFCYLCNELKEQLNNKELAEKARNKCLNTKEFLKELDNQSLAVERIDEKNLKILLFPEFQWFRNLIRDDESTVWLSEARIGVSLFDFFMWHHTPAVLQKLDNECPTSLQLFSAGTAGCDGFDTKYETEAEELNQVEHHSPKIMNGKFLLATPFGYERDIELNASQTLAERHKLSEKINDIVDNLKSSDQENLWAKVNNLEDCIKNCFSKTIIRTGRPFNDITLADHSISSAALAVAHAARVAIESEDVEDGEKSELPYYALPMRKKHRMEGSEWPVTEFAVFSCAINIGYLEDMALEMKDITAIRNGTKTVLNKFSNLFSTDIPVGAEVYKDHHGVHVVVPVLGDPARRWILGNAEPNLDLENPADIPWMEQPERSCITNDNFISWLFDVAKKELNKKEFPFGSELLIALRYHKVGDKLNRLADAISWSRKISFLSAGTPPASQDEILCSFNYNPDNSPDGPDTFSGPRGICVNCSKKSEAYDGTKDENDIDKKLDKHCTIWVSTKELDICPVCRLRFPDPLSSDDDSSLSPEERWKEKKKCRICRDRVKKYSSPSNAENEIMEIDEIAEKSTENRLSLITLSFDLSRWLSEGSNTGIFCYRKGTKKPEKFKTKRRENQRLNSFGRFRRIWRSTESFLKEVRNDIRNLCSAQVGTNITFFMRTILLGPQDLQVIVPAHCVYHILLGIIDNYYDQFEKLPGRVPFHISVLVFPYRVPIYLILEAARRLKEMALSTELKEVGLRKEGNSFFCRRLLNDRCFESQYKINHVLKDGTDRLPKGIPPNAEDQFFSNVEILTGNATGSTWEFVADLPDNSEVKALMVLNRLCLAEIGSGLILNEIGLPSEYLPSFKSHDVPMEYWNELLGVISAEENIKQKQKRTLRSVLTKREIFWDRHDPVVNDILERSCEMLWRERERLGSKRWGGFTEREKSRLVKACLNGGVFLASFIEERLGYI